MFKHMLLSAAATVALGASLSALAADDMTKACRHGLAGGRRRLEQQPVFDAG